MAKVIKHEYRTPRMGDLIAWKDGKGLIVSKGRQNEAPFRVIWLNKNFQINHPYPQTVYGPAKILHPNFSKWIASPERPDGYRFYLHKTGGGCFVAGGCHMWISMRCIARYYGLGTPSNYPNESMKLIRELERKAERRGWLKGLYAGE